MRERYFLRADWFDRRENAAESADRMIRMLNGLSKGHRDIAKWHHGLVAEPLETDVAGEERLTNLFAHRTAHRDDNGERIVGSGYTMHAHNDLYDNRHLRMHVYTGCWKSAPRLDGRSWLTLDLPIPGNPGDDLLSVPALMPILKSIIEGWDPDYLLLGSSDIHGKFFEMERENNRRGPGPDGNWIIYLSSPFASLVTAPTGIAVTPLPGFGVFWVADDQPCSIDNPEQLRRCAEVHEALAPIRAYLRRWVLEPPGRNPRVDLTAGKS